MKDVRVAAVQMESAPGDKDGNFELKFMRPGEQYIQVAPFNFDPAQAPAGTTVTLTLEAGETKEGVELTGK